MYSSNRKTDLIVEDLGRTPVKTGGRAVKHLHKIQAQNPRHLLDSFASLCDVVCG